MLEDHCSIAEILLSEICTKHCKGIIATREMQRILTVFSHHVWQYLVVAGENGQFHQWPFQEPKFEARYSTSSCRQRIHHLVITMLLDNFQSFPYWPEKEWTTQSEQDGLSGYWNYCVCSWPTLAIEWTVFGIIAASTKHRLSNLPRLLMVGELLGQFIRVILCGCKL